jgi:hypothetical protein
MRCFARTRFLPLAISTFLLLLLLPTVAWAGWGDENWGEMVWGAAAPQIPAMPIAGVAALAALILGLSYWLVTTRRRRANRPPLRS